MNEETRPDPELEADLRPGYDLSELLKGGVRGKYAERYREGTNRMPICGEVRIPHMQLLGAHIGEVP